MHIILSLFFDKKCGCYGNGNSENMAKNGSCNNLITKQANLMKPVLKCKKNYKPC